MKRAYIFLLLIIVIHACSLNPPETEFEYRGRSYNLNYLEILQDGIEETIALSGDDNGQFIVNSLSKTMDETLDEYLGVENSTAYEDLYDIAGIATAFYNFNWRIYC